MLLNCFNNTDKDGRKFTLSTLRMKLEKNLVYLLLYIYELQICFGLCCYGGCVVHDD